MAIEELWKLLRFQHSLILTYLEVTDSSSAIWLRIVGRWLCYSTKIYGGVRRISTPRNEMGFEDFAL